MESFNKFEAVECDGAATYGDQLFLTFQFNFLLLFIHCVFLAILDFMCISWVFNWKPD